MSKADAILALDELTFDQNRFERAAAFARSLGVSEARITVSRFYRAFATGEIEGMKRLLPEADKALASMPAEETEGADLSGARSGLVVMKKALERGDQDRMQVSLAKFQRGAEARAILFDLRRIDAAVDQCALKQRLVLGAVIPASEWLKYVRPGRLRETGADVFGAVYGDQIVGTDPKPNPASLAKVSGHVPEGYFNFSEGNRRP